jgi:glycosyltransferase involved in cell wall biosynthesis
MKRVAVLTPVFPYPKRGVYTGIERHIEGLCFALSRIKSVKVEIITSFWNDDNKSDAQDEINGIPIYRVTDLREKIGRLSGFAELDFLSLGFQMYRKLRELGRYDYIVFNLPFPYSRWTNTPSATLLHHYQPIQNLAHMLSVPFGNAYFKLMRTEVYVAPSEYSARMFTRNLGVDSTKIKIIPEGVDPSFAKGSSTRIRDEIGGGTILLCVGNLIHSKGVLKLLQMFGAVSTFVSDAKLIFVGDGPLKSTLTREIISLGLEKVVFLKGFVDDEELPDYYAACDIFVSFSTMEGFGLVFAEAMMAGKPILAFNSASIGEVVGEAGLLAGSDVEMQKNMVDLLTDEKFRLNLSKKASERSKRYSWDVAARLLLEALGEHEFSLTDSLGKDSLQIESSPHLP